MDGEFSRFNSQDKTNNTEGANRSSVRYSSQSSSTLKGKDRFSQAFNVLLNYWEIKPSQYEAKLHELALKDVRVVSSFVPWAHVETDIYHSLKKFVRAAWAVKLNVRIFVMPELGVNYPNAGIPKDLLANIANLAVDRVGRVIYNYAAPNIFPLPSFSAPEVLKRFGNYLIKVGSILGEVFSEVGNSDFCEIVVSNSLFNYYRSYSLSGGDHGDYSAAHVMAFRDFLDREYRSAQGGDSEQFKMQLYEGYNRHRFFTHIEKLLREKTDMVFARKSSACNVRHVDLFNPECSPEAAYRDLLIELFDFHPSVESYYEGVIAGGHRSETIYLGNSGIFRKFIDQEKSFLILAALIHAGEVGVMGEELFKLSTTFQRRLRSLVDFLEERKLSRQTRVSYISASKFSMEDHSFQTLAGMAPGVLSVVGGLDAHSKQLSERLIFMDPRAVVRVIELVQLLTLAQAGKVVAIPAPMANVANYTADALAHFDKFRKGKQPLRLNTGIAYEVYEYHLGHVVFYNPQAFWNSSEKPDSARFFQALLGLAEVKSLCTLSDQRVHAVSYVSEENSTQSLVFLINPTSEGIEVNLGFSNPVLLAGVPQMGGSVEASPLLGKSFELAVPARGVLTVQLSLPSSSEVENAKPENEAGLWT
ncbi:MAG: hypothetical protein AB1540_11060 [Bdellovibrionota bacterium]